MKGYNKCTRTERKFKVNFLENKASNEKFLFYIFDFFFRVGSPSFRLYHQLPTTLYMCLPITFNKYIFPANISEILCAFEIFFPV